MSLMTWAALTPEESWEEKAGVAAMLFFKNPLAARDET